MRPARSDTDSQILGTNEIWTAWAAVRLGHLHNIGNVASGSQRVSLLAQVIKTHLQPPLPLVTPDVKLGIGSLGLTCSHGPIFPSYTTTLIMAKVSFLVNYAN